MRQLLSKGTQHFCRRPALWLGLVLLAWTAAESAARSDDWPQWLGPKRDGVWRETGILEKFPKGGPKVRWRTRIRGGYAGPAVAGGRVYVTDRVLAPGASNPQSGFDKTVIKGSERVLCLDEKTGQVLWKYEYNCAYQVAYSVGPRTTPVVHGGKVYTLGTMGDLFCLDTQDGKVLWSKNFPRDYNAPVPLWGFAASPLLDGDRLICLVGGPGSVAVAFHKDTGKELWRALSSREIGYAPPVIFDYGGARQLIVWHPESVNSLNPETGAVYWSQRFPARGMVKAALTIPTPRLDDDHLFLTSFYNGALMLKLNSKKPAAKVLWQIAGRSEQPEDTLALHAIMSTPFLKDGYIYGVDSYGELRCLKEDDGERLWMTRQATGGKSLRWANAFLVPQDHRYFLFNELGDLIIAHLSPKGYQEISRAHILDPTNGMAGGAKSGGPRLVFWSHPAFANRSMYARNDSEIVCVSLAADENK